MKKILSFVLLFVFAFSFVSCSPEKEVEYYEKQELYGSYDIDKLQELTADEAEAMIGKFIKVTFIAESLEYDDSYFRVFRFSSALSNDPNSEDAFKPKPPYQSLVWINASTTTPFYMDDTKLGDLVTVKGFVLDASGRAVDGGWSGINIAPAFIVK